MCFFCAVNGAINLGLCIDPAISTNNSRIINGIYFLHEQSYCNILGDGNKTPLSLGCISHQMLCNFNSRNAESIYIQYFFLINFYVFRSF